MIPLSRHATPEWFLSHVSPFRRCGATLGYLLSGSLQQVLPVKPRKEEVLKRFAASAPLAASFSLTQHSRTRIVHSSHPATLPQAACYSLQT